MVVNTPISVWRVLSWNNKKIKIKKKLPTAKWKIVMKKSNFKKHEIINYETIIIIYLCISYSY